MLAETPLTADQKDFVEAIDEASGRAIEMTRRLQQLARDTQPTTASPPLDLATALGGVEPLLRRAVHAPLVLEMRVPSTPLPVALSPTDVDQLVLNLAVNARARTRREAS